MRTRRTRPPRRRRPDRGRPRPLRRTHRHCNHMISAASSTRTLQLHRADAANVTRNHTINGAQKRASPSAVEYNCFAGYVLVAGVHARFHRPGDPCPLVFG
jgi:hypothetical protein